MWTNDVGHVFIEQVAMEADQLIKEMTCRRRRRKTKKDEDEGSVQDRALRSNPPDQRAPAMLERPGPSYIR